MLDMTEIPTLAESIPPPSVEDGPLYRLTVDQYHRWIRDGAFDDLPVELLEGLLFEKMSKDPIHGAVNDIAGDLFRGLCPPGWFIRNQNPVTTHDSEPEPDLSIVRGRARDYLRRHPGPAETALLLEVANTSLARDRNVKRRVYAAARCPIYWILNTAAREIEVYTDPRAAGRESYYADRKIHRVGDRMPVVIDGREVGTLLVDDLIPAVPQANDE